MMEATQIAVPIESHRTVISKGSLKGTGVLLPLAIVLVIGLVAFLAVPVFSGPAGNLTCSIRSTSCLGGETDVLHLSNGTNAHAELPNGTAYDLKVCCNDTTGLNQVLNYTGFNFAKLSDPTNAHVETPSNINYTHLAYIGANASGVGCDYRYVEGDCSSFDQTCLFTMSDTSNAHVANCTTGYAYNLTVCCQMIGLNASTIVRVVNDTAADGPDARYWDNVNDGDTIAYLNNTRSNITCRWNETDIGFNSMSAGCSVTSGVSSANITCSFGNLVQGTYDRYVACYDNVTGYAQGDFDNTYVPFGVDYTGPTSAINVTNGTWFNASFTLNVNDTDVTSRIKDCFFNVTDIGVGQTVNDSSRVVNATYFTSINTINVTVGPAANCSAQGANKCSVTGWCTDWAQNTGT